MIKRLYNIARSNVNRFLRQRTLEGFVDVPGECGTSAVGEEEFGKNFQPLASYYANLEILPGSTREQVRTAWKKLMKKYHPDLHSTDPEKRETANELTRRLTESYKILDKELMDRAKDGSCFHRDMK